MLTLNQLGIMLAILMIFLAGVVIGIALIAQKSRKNQPNEHGFY